MPHDRTQLTRLRNAIIDNTKGEAMFWLGEILLDVLKQETGFDGQMPIHLPHPTPQ